MMALQKSLLEQSDIVPVLKELEFQNDQNGNLSVINPPNFKIEEKHEIENFDNFETIGSD